MFVYSPGVFELPLSLEKIPPLEPNFGKFIDRPQIKALVSDVLSQMLLNYLRSPQCMNPSLVLILLPPSSSPFK